MDHPGFWQLAGPFSLREIAARIDLPEPSNASADIKVAGIKALEDAGASDISFFSNKKYLNALVSSAAGCVIVGQAFLGKVPGEAISLVVADPYLAFAKVLELFYPDATATRAYFVDGASGAESQRIAPSARLEEGVVVEPGAIVGPEAQIGGGTRIASGAVIGYRCAIGRGSYVGPNASITHALIGNRVIIHGGARIGQDGFGFAMGAGGHYKVPQVGRVIIQDDVEIGANSTIDRGALRDTVIGEGTKIDNLVQIAHNVVIGRHCVVVAQTGISGSTVLEDFVVLGGQCGTVGHIRIGTGAMVAAQSGLASDIPAGERWGGYPAKPMSLWTREVATLKSLAKRKPKRPPPSATDL